MAMVVALGLASAGTVAATPAPPTLTNLSHLDALTTAVTPPAQAGHTTYQLATEPTVGELWVYANRQSDGSYQPVGGGAFDPVANTYGQGAYDADDVARASVVYLRYWQQHHDAHSRAQAYALLRGLTYLQTASGPNAGNVVLWMQPDGTLNPTPTPPDTPAPADSGASYWLARTIWALGEGYADFRSADPGFASFLRQRLDLAIAALQREVLVNYGKYQVTNGLRTPAWLIVNGADASAEAVLGLSAYVRAGGGPAARTALRELARGIADMGAGNLTTWPYGAILPSATTRSQWHAWGAQMPSALAAAATALSDPSLLGPAVRDATLFTPQLLIGTGPDNGLLPAPVDGSQIAYGADARVQALFSVGQASGSTGLEELAGIAAGWFFGQNPSGQPTYDPTTGVTFDGVAADGTINHGSGAESTIHGLLTMLTLDAHPGLAALAQHSARVQLRDGQQVIEAEAAHLQGDATVVTADPAYTGEGQWSGGAYVQLGSGSRLSWTLPPSSQPRIVEPIIDRVPGTAGTSAFTVNDHRLGSVQYGGGGAQGVSATPGALLPVALDRAVPAGAGSLVATTTGSGRLDALLITPVVSELVLSGGGRSTAVLSSRSSGTEQRSLLVAGTTPATIETYDRDGRLERTIRTSAAQVDVPVLSGGFSLVIR